jgi:hypothetical protein
LSIRFPASIDGRASTKYRTRLLLRIGPAILPTNGTPGTQQPPPSLRALRVLATVGPR